MSMRIVPSGEHATTYSHHLKTAGAPSAPGLYDTLRNGVGAVPLSTASSGSGVDPVTSRHPLESRLKAWEATQEAVRMESLRKTFGVAEPIRRGMELKVVRDGEWRPLALGGSGRGGSVHEDILRGRETRIDWEDVFTGEEQTAGGVVGIHDEMERKLKI
ncbi:proteasome maturation factor [Apiospora kogelbergensis]|uniref:proteasome maturation factor n=1 Tax=Apiospora kogelbergensis TaxID=1337665 RepID=UPI00312FA484